MLTDHWVIVELLLSVVALVMLGRGAAFSLQIVKNWRRGSGSELQLVLERKSYLISTIVSIALVLQILSLFFFLAIANHKVPEVITGAMCAQGALEINAFGFPALYIKMIAMVFYFVFMSINQLDDSEAENPLTPMKYYWVFPCLLFTVADFSLTYLYFNKISPDIITTCCSVSFNTQNGGVTDFIMSSQWLELGLWLWGISFILLALSIWKRKWQGMLIMTPIFIALAVYTLKFFFIKYIYGLPSHLCLFDMFMPRYYSVGYLLFGAYFLLLFGVIGFTSKEISKKRLSFSHSTFEIFTLRMSGIAMFIAFLVPIIYWSLWDGVL